MRDKIFLDSNVAIYAYLNSDKRKQNVSKQLIQSNITVISTQVLQELANTMRKKAKAEYSVIKPLLLELAKNCHEVYINTEKTILCACAIAERYGFSFYDSLIAAAAIESGCRALYSEDMQHNQLIEGKLKVVNPFL
jgi:predicted nucleic acid-binding protein